MPVTLVMRPAVWYTSELESQKEPSKLSINFPKVSSSIAMRLLLLFFWLRFL